MYEVTVFHNLVVSFMSCWIIVSIAAIVIIVAIVLIARVFSIVLFYPPPRSPSLLAGRGKAKPGGGYKIAAIVKLSLLSGAKVLQCHGVTVLG